jgi:hypothetical protein
MVFFKTPVSVILFTFPLNTNLALSENIMCSDQEIHWLPIFLNCVVHRLAFYLLDRVAVRALILYGYKFKEFVSL